MALNGTDVLLLVNTGTEEAPVYTAVGSQRGVTFDENTAEIDVSSKDSRAMRVLPGRYDASLSLDSLYVPDDTAYQALRDANRNGDFILVRRSEEEVETEEASAIVTAMSEEFPDQAEATISVDLRIDGEWSEVGS